MYQAPELPWKQAGRWSLASPWQDARDILLGWPPRMPRELWPPFPAALEDFTFFSVLHQLPAEAWGLSPQLPLLYCPSNTLSHWVFRDFTTNFRGRPIDPGLGSKWRDMKMSPTFKKEGLWFVIAASQLDCIPATLPGCCPQQMGMGVGESTSWGPLAWRGMPFNIYPSILSQPLWLLCGWSNFSLPGSLRVLPWAPGSSA